MTYQDVVSWMFQQLPVYQNIGAKAYKTDLSNSIKLSRLLSHPERSFKSVHIAGTNGKGSTSHMMASILQEAGYKTGLYTSPHLKDFRERIRVNGHPISESYVVEFIESYKSHLEAMQLSFFEMTVGMAFKYFEYTKVDIAIVEVGLGGRLDSTNILLPFLSVITNIGMDHTSILGNTLEEIAVEKAGIIKSNIPVVIGETQKETAPIFKAIAEQKGSSIYFADQLINYSLPTDLKGNYQIKNVKTVLQAIELVRQNAFDIHDTDVSQGLMKVVQNTGLQGRWQILGHHPLIICDTAHNKEGLSLVMNQLIKETYHRLHIVFGVVREKDIDSIIPLMPREASYYFCTPKIERGLDSNILLQKFAEIGISGSTFNSVFEAYKEAKKLAEPEDVIYVGGSTFVVAEVI